jgi:acyl-CoA reductase-like NAD-dependent aldehyde dehydrogenase
LREEVFGPEITILPVTTDDELIAIANDCDFALGANIFGPLPHARAIGKRIAAGMVSHNDFSTTSMCQSLPMGGLKHSGFGKFAGVEGLRDLCVTKAVA